MRNFHLKERTTLRLPLQAHASTQERYPLADAQQTKMAAFGEVVEVEIAGKSQPIILDGNHQCTRGSMLDTDLNGGSFGMTPNVVQAFLDDAEDG